MTFDVKLEGQRLILPKVPLLAAGAREKVFVKLVPDDEWKSLAVTLTFRCVFILGTESRTVLVADQGRPYAVPHEVLRKGWLFIGATGYGADGVEKLTTAEIEPICVHPSEDDGGAASDEITPALAEQLLAAWATVGSLEGLNTEDKSSLVAAINELAAREQGSGVSGYLAWFAAALDDFPDGDSAGLPVYDPLLPEELGSFASMLIERTEAEEGKNTLNIYSKGVIDTIVKRGGVDVTREYKIALSLGKVTGARAYLWTLPAGRYYLYDEENSTRYHLHAMAGELDDGSVVSRLLYVIDDFCDIEFYGGDSVNDYTATPTVKVEGKTGTIYSKGKELGTGDDSNADASDLIYVGEGEMPEGAVLQIDPSGEAPEIVTKEVFDQTIESINATIGTLETELEALL